MLLLTCLLPCLLLLVQTSKENRSCATSGNINSHSESFPSLNAIRESFVCLFVLNVNHHWQSGHGYLKPVLRVLGLCINCTSRMLICGRDRGLEEVSTGFRFLSTIENTHPYTRYAG
jgi:hypothetical protein